MKKIVSLVLAALMLAGVFALTACAKKQEQTTDIRIAALKGPTGMGMVNLSGEEYPH